MNKDSFSVQVGKSEIRWVNGEPLWWVVDGVIMPMDPIAKAIALELLVTQRKLEESISTLSVTEDLFVNVEPCEFLGGNHDSE